MSCVERGRWRSTSPTFRNTNASAPFTLRSGKARQVRESLELLDTIEREQFEEQPGVGVRQDRRFESRELNGFQLVFNHHTIHLAAFNPLDS